MGGEEPQLPVVVGEVVLDKYRVDRIIGVGGMGIVAEAWHLAFDEKVAIKFLLEELVSNAEAVARFEREARVLFKIKSENVCRVIDVGKLDSNVPFMVMEYLEGQDLASALERREPMPKDQAIEYALQACQGLANAHVRGIVHRDLKPENLFLVHEPSGELSLKLLDFGLSKEHGEESSLRQRKLTAKEQVMGTPHYMSPEQWVASTAVSPAADQWALAAIVFEMLTGRPPFDGPQLANICSAIMNNPTPSASDLRPDLPAGIDDVLRKALEKHPRDRYESVGAFAVALAAHSSSKPAAAKAERTLKMLQRSEFNESAVSGAWQTLRSPAVPSDMSATMRKPKLELLERVRAVTSTSWQRMLRQQSTSRAAVAFAALAVMVLVAVAIITIRQGTSGQASDVATTTRAPATGDATMSASPTTTGTAEHETTEASTVASTSPEASADASASASAQAPEPPSSAPPPRPINRPKPTSSPKPAPKPDIFSER